MKLISDGFGAGETIPARYTCDGPNLSPPVRWDEYPDGTRSFALIVDDPDAPAGTWVHWVLYGIDPHTSELPEGVSPEPTLPDGSRQGINDFRRLGYGGPCPPPGGAHRYFFRLYALDRSVDLVPGATKPELLEAMEGHVLDEADVMGLYDRSSGRRGHS
jgi:Raf kinase inhibitor-like YbhB/YbcL family protein